MVKSIGLLTGAYNFFYYVFSAVRKNIKHLVRRIKGPVRILDFQSSLSGPVRGRILLTYITGSFLKENPSSLVSHVNQWEVVEMARILNRMGLIVDVIHYADKKFKPVKPYDVLFGVTPNFERLARILDDSVLKIHYATGCHYIVRNNRLKERFEWLRQRRRVRLRVRGLVAPYESVSLADAVVCIGNQPTCDTYRPYNNRVISLDSSGFDFLKWPEGKDFASARLSFLWMVNRYLIYRGLDLLLEVFKDLPRLKLYLCGPVKEERDFVKIYKKELFGTPNIKTVGWVDIRSKVFEDLTSRCGYIIYPACGEGQSGSVITAMHRGIVPVVTAGAGIDIKDFGIMLANPRIETIREAVLNAAERPPQRLEESARKAYNEAKQRYTRERFSHNFESIMRSLVDGHLKKRP